MKKSKDEEYKSRCKLYSIKALLIKSLFTTIFGVSDEEVQSAIAEVENEDEPRTAPPSLLHMKKPKH